MDRLTLRELTQPHTRLVPSREDPNTYVRGTEYPLLQLLEEAVGSSYGVGGGGGSDRATAPVDLSALTLKAEIDQAIGEWERFTGATPAPGASLCTRARLWFSTLSDENYLRWVDTLMSWASQIREILEPTKRVPLRGAPCPTCGEALVSMPSPLPGGSRTITPALLAHLVPGEPWVECRVCTSRYDKGQLKDLGAEGLYFPGPIG